MKIEMEWISVSDRLPIDPCTVNIYDTKTVIVATHFDDVFTVEYSCGNIGKPWHKFEGCAESYITHWMPIPDPPKQTA